MLDPRILKENPESVRDMLKRRNMTDFPLDELIVLHKRRGELITKTQELRKKKNQLSEAIASKKKKSKQEDVSFELAEMKEVSLLIDQTESEAIQIEEKFNRLMMALPNYLNEGVPVGKGEEDNVVIRQNGRPIRPDFSPKDHVEAGHIA